jgi:hypothetical protein
LTTYNIESIYTEIMNDNGQTWLGEFAQKYNKHRTTLYMDICLYAARNQLANPALVVMLDKPSRGKGRKAGDVLSRKDTTKGITISASKINSVDVLASALEVEVVATEEGLLIRPKDAVSPGPSVEVLAALETVSNLGSQVEETV